MPTARERLVVALDFPRRDRALGMIDRLRGRVGMFKVGKQLFTAEGPAFVREIVERGQKVFLDLKFHDIPNTVSGAIQAAAALKPSLVTVHASGGVSMMKAAARAAEGTGVRVLAVTVLTSLDNSQLTDLGFSEPAERLVLRLARLALDCGLHGVVAAPTEIPLLRSEIGGKPIILAPGIRLASGDHHDQARVATPDAAVRAGADYVVVGRPITEADDPAAVASQIVQMLE